MASCRLQHLVEILGHRTGDYDPGRVIEAAEDGGDAGQQLTSPLHEEPGPVVTLSRQLQDPARIEGVRGQSRTNDSRGEFTRTQICSSPSSQSRANTLSRIDTPDMVQESHLADATVMASQEMTINDDPGTETITREEHHEVLQPHSHADGPLRHRCQAGIILNPHQGHPLRQKLFQIGIHALPESLSLSRGTTAKIDGSGNADAGDEDSLTLRASLEQRRIHGTDDGISTSLVSFLVNVEILADTRQLLATQISDDRSEVRTACVHPHDDGGIRPQLDATRRPPLAVVTCGPGIGEFSEQAEMDQFINGLDGRRSGQSRSLHGVADDEDTTAPREGQHGVKTRPTLLRR